VAPAQPGFLDGTETEGERARLREDIDNLRVWKMTKYLELSTEQSQKFFPLYNDFAKNMGDLDRKRGHLFDQIAKGAELTDYPQENLVKMMDELDQLEMKVLNLKQEFREKASKVLSINQVAKLTVFEHRFQGEIQRMIKEARQRGLQNRPFMKPE